MAKSLNRVDLLGYLGGDAKVKEFPDRTSVGEVSVATDYSVQDGKGAWRDHTEWHSVVIWGAAAAAAVLKKGARVHLTGRAPGLGPGRRTASGGTRRRSCATPATSSWRGFRARAETPSQSASEGGSGDAAS